VLVPARLSNVALVGCSKFRAKRRFPALSFYHSKKGSSLWRSSQNMPGMINHRSEDDELMLRLIGQTNKYSSRLAIYDARSQIKAFSNKVKGGGYENTDYYDNCDISFCSIENIHSVADAYKSIFTLTSRASSVKNNSSVHSKIESSNWYGLIKAILDAVVCVTTDLDVNRKSVLVH